MINLNNKNVLVTGGSGFIGRNFVELILSKYYDLTVVNFDKMGVGSMEYTPICGNGNIYFHYPIDIRWLSKPSQIDIPLPNLKYDYIFHFAAESHVDRSINDPLSFVSNNVIGITSLLEYARLYQPQSSIINVSTDEVYGHLDISDDPFTESSPINPRSPYSASKASADLIANSYHSTYGMDIITTRCCNNFGKYQHDEKLIPTIIKNIVSDNFIPVYGNGQNIREWIYVDDHNNSILEIAGIAESGKCYNIGSGRELTNLQMISDIGRALQIVPKLSFVEDRKGHDFRYAIRSNIYNRQFTPTSHTIALQNTIDFYRQTWATGNK